MLFSLFRNCVVQKEDFREWIESLRPPDSRLCEMGRPLTAADLQQFLCAVDWMRNNIPNYSALVQTFHDLMESGGKQKEKKRKLVHIRLDED